MDISGIWLTSDLHLNHNREFIWKERGFTSIWEMNRTYILNWNQAVGINDDVYVLGDLMLGDNEVGKSLLEQLKGRLHIIRGNHDTDARIEIYNHLWNIVEVVDGKMLDYNGYRFFLSHYPSYTGSLECESLKKTICNFFGHTHSKELFYKDIPFMYNVAVDAHNSEPILIEQAIYDMETKVKECKRFL